MSPRRKKVPSGRTTPRTRVTVAAVRRIATLLIAAIFVIASAALATATGWGGDHDGHNPKYHPKPCFWWSWDRDKDDWHHWGDSDWDKWEKDYKSISSGHDSDKKKCIPFPCKLKKVWDSKHKRWEWKWECDKPEPPNCRKVKIYNSKTKKWEYVNVCEHPKPDCKKGKDWNSKTKKYDEWETCHYPLPRDCKTEKSWNSRSRRWEEKKSCSYPKAECKKTKTYDSKSRSWRDEESWSYKY